MSYYILYYPIGSPYMKRVEAMSWEGAKFMASEAFKAGAPKAWAHAFVEGGSLLNKTWGAHW